MKLSEMTTDQACDVVCKILPNVEAIAADADLQNHFAEMAKVNKDEFDTLAKKVIFCMDTISALALALLKRHKEDLFGILAAMNGTSVDEIKAQNIILTVKQFKDAVKDPDLIQLFK